MGYILQKNPINFGIWFQSERPSELQESKQLCQAITAWGPGRHGHTHEAYREKEGFYTSPVKTLNMHQEKKSHHNNLELVKNQPNKKKHKTLLTVNCPLIKSNNTCRSYQDSVLFQMADYEKWTLHHLGEQSGWYFSCKVVTYWVVTMGLTNSGQWSMLYRPYTFSVI